MKIVKILVDFGADINKFSNNGLYPLHIAALNNHQRIIEYLVDKNTHKNAANLECGTAK